MQNLIKHSPFFGDSTMKLRVILKKASFLQGAVPFGIPRTGCFLAYVPRLHTQDQKAIEPLQVTFLNLTQI